MLYEILEIRLQSVVFSVQLQGIISAKQVIDIFTSMTSIIYTSNIITNDERGNSYDSI